jgi:hypothetical protein
MRAMLVTMACATLAACAEMPEAASTAKAAVRCERAAPTTGTRISRDNSCAPASTPQSREEAKRQAEAMRDHQHVTGSRMPTVPGSATGR